MSPAAPQEWVPHLGLRNSDLIQEAVGRQQGVPSTEYHSQRLDGWGKIKGKSFRTKGTVA
jgi:hypothetical protein